MCTFLPAAENERRAKVHSLPLHVVSIGPFNTYFQYKKLYQNGKLRNTRYFTDEPYSFPKRKLLWLIKSWWSLYSFVVCKWVLNKNVLTTKYCVHIKDNTTTWKNDHFHSFSCVLKKKFFRSRKISAPDFHFLIREEQWIKKVLTTLLTWSSDKLNE